MKRTISSLLVISLLLLNGCGEQRVINHRLSWADLVSQLDDFDSIAKVEGFESGIFTSVDPSGSNNDFNHPIRSTKDGWDVIAELDGPGYISRFWMTGASDHTLGLKIFIDGEKVPRLDGTIGDWFVNAEPFRAPIAMYENYCWHSYVPIPFSKSIEIRVKGGTTDPNGWPRIFYQVNWVKLPGDYDVQSFTREIPADVAAAYENVQAAWENPTLPEFSNTQDSTSVMQKLGPGETAKVLGFEGAGIIRTLDMTFEALEGGAAGTSRALRNCILNVEYDGSGVNSIAVPVGDFFGSFWRPTGFQSAYFGKTGGTYQSRWPMPFRNGVTISLRNEGAEPVTLQMDALVERTDSLDPALGYLHAAWTRTYANQLGVPHDVLRTTGKGRFAGCTISTLSHDKSWWLLEGDESIRVDEEGMPGWLGTGLEDYFNCGWYYQNVKARPLHGLVFKAPYRTIQYRLHLPDFVGFDQSIDMVFERGPDSRSRGDMESIGYYYMAEPQQAPSRLMDAARRQAPMDQHMTHTIMTELLNHERLGDPEGAIHCIDEYLQKVQKFPFEEMLRLRRLAYRERIEGFESVKSEIEGFTASQNPLVKQQAEDLLWFHEDPSHALLVLNCNVPVRAYIDGEAVGEGGSMDKASVHRVIIKPGDHTLLLESRRKTKPYPEWVLAALRTHRGDVFTQPWKTCAYGTASGMFSSGLDQVDWQPLFGTGVKGPPEVPFIWLEPHALVFMESGAAGLRPPDKWPPNSNLCVFRQDFSL